MSSAHVVSFLLFRLADALIVLMPLRLCWFLGELGGSVAYWFEHKRRRLVFRNLLIALGNEMGKGECRRIARRHFRVFTRNRLCGWRMSRMGPLPLERLVRYENRQKVLEIAEAGEGVIVALSRCGPWEMFSRLSVFGPGVKIGFLHSACGNPYLDRYFTGIRAPQDLQLFPREEGFYEPLEHLNRGGILGLNVDQVSPESVVWSPLFGRLTPSPNQAAILSQRTGAPVIPVHLYPDGVARWRVVFEEPIYPPRSLDERQGGVTAELNQFLERSIRRDPEEWNWAHERWKTPLPEFLLRGYERGIEYPKGCGAESLQKFRILVRSPNWLGDACMAVPTVRALKNGRPDAEITVLCNENLRELWERVGHVDRVVAKGRVSSVMHVARLIRREGRFDAGVLFPNSTRSALEMRWAGVKPVVGYQNTGRMNLLQIGVEEAPLSGPPEHHARRYMRIARAVGADQSDPDVYGYRPNDPDYKGRWRIGICPGAAYGDAKRWPVQRYAETIEALDARWQGEVDWVVLGAPKEVDIGRKLEKACRVELENLVGKTSLEELMDELCHQHVLISNDTGTMHLAGLLGVPTVAIFGSTEPDLTAPLGADHEIVRERVECSPCFLRSCPLDFRCMEEVTVERVVAATGRILERIAEGQL